jgi:hypothetical protein
MKNENTPANPCVNGSTIHLGLTKLEYFAGLAMQGLIAGAEGAESEYSYSDLALYAEKHATALIAQLEKSNAD